VLDFLPAHYGDALELKYVDGLTVAELAAHLGRTEKATESLLTRARDAFRLAASDLFAEGVEVIRP
jgi:RNA polymerase sigma-70 factor (ECF subfamily)